MTGNICSLFPGDFRKWVWPSSFSGFLWFPFAFGQASRSPFVSEVDPIVDFHTSYGAEVRSTGGGALSGFSFDTLKLGGFRNPAIRFNLAF